MATRLDNRTRVRSLAARYLAAASLLPSLAFAEDLYVDPEVDPTPTPIVAGQTKTGATWALLPIIGFSPNTSVVAGLKFREGDFLRDGMIIDLEGAYALEMQQRYSIKIDDERLLGSQFSFRVEGGFTLDPSLEFFGLGADAPGPDESSNHLEQRWGGEVLAGFWPWDQVHVSFGAGWETVDIGTGRQTDVPDTATTFPTLVGIDGGEVKSLVGELVYDQYPEDFLRMRGARVRVLVEEVNPLLDNEFDFTRFIGGASYIVDLYRREYAIGLRVRGEIVEGSSSEVPFFALPTLGGATTLRGFFPDRFRGRGSLLANLELRGILFGFDFFDIWHVRLGAAAFVDAGRVFSDIGELQNEWDQGYELSYGGGIRFILGEAILARVDVGFSDEESAQIFLRFGQMF